MNADALYNRGNAFLAAERYAEALASYDRALELQPADREALNNRGVALHALARHQEALDSYDRALLLRADYAEAYNNRSTALRALGRDAEALASCERALELRPRYREALTNRAALLHDLGRDAEALAAYEAVMALEPASVATLVNRGNVLAALRRFDEALASYAQALRLDPDDAQAHWNEALTRLAIGDFATGFRKYEWRWRNPALKSPPRDTAKPLWLGEHDVRGKTVLVHPEQGFGDAILAIRYIPLLAARGARVVVACHGTLVELFRTVEGAHHVTTPHEPLPEFDCHVPIMSLPLAFGTTLDSIPARVPYLAPDAAKLARWRERLARHGARRKIGLAWKGNPALPRASAKACAVEHLEPLLATPGCAFCSLQKGEPAPRAASDYARELGSFADTAALLCALDVVITTDTAVAHLAGALGKPVWILLPWAADWRWLSGRDDSPWYPSARLFRQPQPGDWPSVIDAVARELATMGAS